MMEVHTTKTSRAPLGALVVSLVFAACNPASTDNWTPLFDGKTLDGWKMAGGEAPYTIEDGAIVGTMTAGTPNSFLITEQEYGDFILEIDVKLEGETTNSGIQTRRSEEHTSELQSRENLVCRLLLE